MNAKVGVGAKPSSAEKTYVFVWKNKVRLENFWNTRICKEISYFLSAFLLSKHILLYIMKRFTFLLIYPLKHRGNRSTKNMFFFSGLPLGR